MANELHQILGKDIFLLDGAATMHMVDSWVVLQDERPVNMLVKGLGNKQASSKGVLCVRAMILGPALRVHGLGTNLISEGVLQTRGYEVMSKGNWRKVMLKGEVVISAALENGLFVWRPCEGLLETVS
jgi:hypothetical protein